MHTWSSYSIYYLHSANEYDPRDVTLGYHDMNTIIPTVGAFSTRRECGSLCGLWFISCRHDWIYSWDRVWWVSEGTWCIGASFRSNVKYYPHKYVSHLLICLIEALNYLLPQGWGILFGVEGRFLDHPSFRLGAVSPAYLILRCDSGSASAYLSD